MTPCFGVLNARPLSEKSEMLVVPHEIDESNCEEVLDALFDALQKEPREVGLQSTPLIFREDLPVLHCRLRAVEMAAWALFWQDDNEEVIRLVLWSRLEFGNFRPGEDELDTQCWLSIWTTLRYIYYTVSELKSFRRADVR